MSALSDIVGDLEARDFTTDDFIASSQCPQMVPDHSETRDLKQLDRVICILHTESVLNLRRRSACFEHACNTGFHVLGDSLCTYGEISELVASKAVICGKICQFWV